MNAKFCSDCGTFLEITEKQAYCHICNKISKLTYQQASIVQEKVFIQQTPQEFLQTQASRPVTTEICPKCGHDKAYYSTQQMRSADEGQTVFYECVKCAHQYKENT